MRTLYHLIRADFLERIRRFSFLIVLALTIWAGYLFVPPEDAGYHVLQVGVQRGIYNSAWIGLMFGMIAVMYLPLFGFYLVKNAVERDRQTGVGQIIAATPSVNLIYVLGKWLSNLAVLGSILSIMTLMAAVMQLLRGEVAMVNLGALLGPIWLMGMPVLFIAAALAVLFECTSILQGSLGNIAFFFLWLSTIGVVISGAVDEATDRATVTADLFGYTRQLVDIQGQVLSNDPEADLGTGLIIVGKDIERTFVWEGIAWRSGILLERVMWAGLGVVIAMGAAIPFDRFDPARRKPKHERPALFAPVRRWVGSLRTSHLPSNRSNAEDSLPTEAVRLTPLTTAPSRGRFFGLLAAELKLMVKGHNPIWYAIALGLMVACLVSPLNFVRQYLFPTVWLWPLLVWSQIGIRERRHNTAMMVFSTPRPMLRQLPAQWLAGVIFTVIVGSGAWMRLALAGDMGGVFAWSVGALFTPSLALALGIWVGNSRAFEVIYPLWWYIGVVNKVPAFDYSGVTAEASGMGSPIVYLGITAGLMVLALIGRWRQLAT